MCSKAKTENRLRDRDHAPDKYIMMMFNRRMEGQTMNLWKTLFLIRDGQATALDSIRSNVVPAFPSGSLTASAWEGWWHDETPSPLDTRTSKGPTMKLGT